MSHKSAVDKMRNALRSAETWVPWKDALRSDPCVYCVVWPMPDREQDRKSLEHILPLSEGGKNGWRNLAGAHELCNANRSSAPLLRFFLYRQAAQRIPGPEHRKARQRLKQFWCHRSVQPTQLPGSPR